MHSFICIWIARFIGNRETTIHIFSNNCWWIRYQYSSKCIIQYWILLHIFCESSADLFISLGKLYFNVKFFYIWQFIWIFAYNVSMHLKFYFPFIYFELCGFKGREKKKENILLNIPLTYYPYSSVSLCIQS